MPLVSQCIGCGVSISYGTTRCEKCQGKYIQNKKVDVKNYDKTERKNHDVYHDKRWGILTEQCRNQFNGLDIYQLYISNRIVYGNMSHHVILIEDDYDRRFDINNLIYLNEIESHRLIHSVYDKSDRDKKEMQELLFNLIERFKSEYGSEPVLF